MGKVGDGKKEAILTISHISLGFLTLVFAASAVADPLLDSALTNAAKTDERISLEWKNANAPLGCSGGLAQKKIQTGGCEYKILTTERCATAAADTLVIGAPFNQQFSVEEVSLQTHAGVGLVGFQGPCVTHNALPIEPIDPISQGSLCHVRYAHGSTGSTQSPFEKSARVTENIAVGFLRQSGEGNQLETLSPARPAALESRDLGTPVFCEIERRSVFAGVLIGENFQVSSSDVTPWIRENTGAQPFRAPLMNPGPRRTLAVLPIEDASPRALGQNH